jgi:hypothetical protein
MSYFIFQYDNMLDEPHMEHLHSFHKLRLTASKLEHTFSAEAKTKIDGRFQLKMKNETRGCAIYHSNAIQWSIKMFIT